MTIAWECVARPQSDGSDTTVALEILKTGRYAGRPDLIGDGPPVWEDGRARWTSIREMPSPEFQQLPHDNPNVVSGLQLLDLWPDARRQSAALLLAICPLTRGGLMQGGHGCCCGNYHDDFGWIYVTVDDAWGFAEGIVHEMAHWKLRALGVQFEEWDGLLLQNAPTQLYDSPVRKDKPRPMGAVLHAQYSYVYVAEMVRRMYEAKPDADSADAQWLSLQLKRIAEGQETLRAFALGTPEAGTAFLEGLDIWTSEVLMAGRVALPAEVTL